MSIDIFFRYALEFSLVFPGAFMSILPVYRHLRINKHFFFIIMTLTLIGTIIAGSIICSLTKFPTNSLLLPFLVPCFIAYNLCFDLSVFKKVYCFTTAMLITSFATTYTTFLTAPLELSNTMNVFYCISGAVALGIGILLCIVFFHLLRINLPELMDNESIDNTWKWLMIIPIVFSAGVIWMKPLSAQNVMTGRMRIVSLVVLIVIPLSAWVLNYIFWWIASKITESEKLKQSYNLLQMEEKQYHKTMRYLEETRNMRHDFRHHLHVISELAKDGKIERLLEYINQFSETSSENPKRFCANNIVNAIAAHYNSIAEKKDVKIFWKLNLDENIPIKEADLCAVLGNLIENSINAVQSLPLIDRSIHAAVGTIADKTVIVSIKNPYNGVIPIGKDGLPVANKPNHGIGLRSVANMVDRYSGSLVINTENRLFNVSILMYKEE